MERKFLVKRALRHTWVTFFSRFTRPSPVQEKVIPLVLAGKDVAVLSSTASGKTESVVAPLAEKYLQERWEGLSVLYISPTRALVNDMYFRLREQLTELGISISIKTGDKPYFKPDKPSNFLVTTTESLDSLICRHPYVFKTLKAIVIDEIHFLDGNYRGDQMRILLKRLSEVTEEKFNIYILSATVSSPEVLAKRYIPSPEIISVLGKREIEYTLVPSYREIFEFMKKEGLRKLLVFCNARRDVEEDSTTWSSLIGHNRVVVHHGSLSKKERESAETFMKETQIGVCISTMTLEIGIDIGDIDAVVLGDVPYTVSSLLQRIGRGNRKSNKIRVFAIFKDKQEREILKHMLDMAIRGEIETKKYTPDFSVIVQQIFSSLYQCPEGRSYEYFLRIFKDFCEERILRMILDYLIEKGWIIYKRERWYGTSQLFDWAKRGRGRIHSNIPDEKTLKVIDISTKKVIGEISLDEIKGNSFVLSGRAWKIIEIKKDIIYVKLMKIYALPPYFKFKLNMGYFTRFLPPDIHKILPNESNEKLK